MGKAVLMGELRERRMHPFAQPRPLFSHGTGAQLCPTGCEPASDRLPSPHARRGAQEIGCWLVPRPLEMTQISCTLIPYEKHHAQRRQGPDRAGAPCGPLAAEDSECRVSGVAAAIHRAGWEQA